MKLCVLDFETANSKLASACSIGVIVIENGMIIKEYSSLIQPHPAYDYFDPFNVSIHNITYEMIKDAPTFEEIYVELLECFEGSILMAHNASFDMAVLNACMHTYGLKKPKINFIDSLEIARKCYPQLHNHKLNTVCSYLNIPLNHHDALSDARGSTLIAMNTMSDIEEFDVENWIDLLHLKQRIL